MKRSIIPFSLFSVFISCNGNEPVNEEPVLHEVEKIQDVLVGTWNMDSSVFYNNGIRGEATPPMMPTTWTFSEDGSYAVENSVKMPGTYTRNDDSIFIILMGVPNDYEIMYLDNVALTVRSTIIDTDSASVKTDAFLTRTQN